MLLTLEQIVSHATRLANTPGVAMSLASEYANIAIAQYVSQDAGIQHAPKEAVAFTSTTTSDNRLAFPSDFDYAIGAKLGTPNSNSTATSRTTSWTPLTKVFPPDGTPYQSDTSGVPISYAEFATWFELRPSPLSAYSVELRYMRKVSEITSSTATPNLDEQWHWACALKTAELLAMNASDTTMEALNRQRYVTYLNILRTDQGKKRMDERGQRVVVRWR